VVLAPRVERLRLWVYEADLAERMRSRRENDLYLPGTVIPAGVEIVTELGDALEEAELVVGAMPSQVARELYRRMRAYLKPDMAFLSATKGLEDGTLLRISQVIEQVLGEPFAPRIAVLSGPSFAQEVARGHPTALVVAARDQELAARIQVGFSGPSLRLYRSSDLVGVELGGALKNVIALGAGICQGLGLGSNTIASLVTRGLAEIARLATAMGAKPATLAGLAGLGDLVLTCTGELSRNRWVGIQLGRGRELGEVIASMRMVAEGVNTCRAAVELGRRYGVELPICQQVYRIIYEGWPVRQAIQELMERSLKEE